MILKRVFKLIIWDALIQKMKILFLRLPDAPVWACLSAEAGCAKGGWENNTLRFWCFQLGRTCWLDILTKRLMPWRRRRSCSSSRTTGCSGRG